MELQIIRVTEDFRNSSAPNLNDQSRALTQTLAQFWMSCITPGMFQRLDGKPLRHVAKAQTYDLRENKPHPVRPFLAL